MSNYEIPKTARVTVLTGPKKIEVLEVPVPDINEDEVLVKVEQWVVGTRRDWDNCKNWEKRYKRLLWEAIGDRG